MSVLNITQENFNTEVLKSDKPVLIDFWAEWCGPCRMLSPVIEELADEVTDAKIAKINIDKENELAVQFGVMSIPTLVVVKNGKAVSQAVGVQPKQKILQLLQEA
ncbi:thioredoxin 1 [Lachnospiraceae bacterium PF1-21]